MKKKILKIVGIVLIFMALSALAINILTFDDPPTIGFNTVMEKDI